MSTEKQKDSAFAAPTEFRLEEQDTGAFFTRGAAAGQPITSAVLVAVDPFDKIGSGSDVNPLAAPEEWENFPIPDEVATFTGKGGSWVPRIARYMASVAEGDPANMGTAQKDVFEAVGAVKPPKNSGISDPRSTARNAWSWLLANHYIEPSPNYERSTSDTGRHIWSAGIHDYE